MKWVNKFLFSLTLVMTLPLLLGGCGTTVTIPTVFDQSLIITGESLSTMGQLFVSTGNAMNTGLDSKQVTAAQYNSWRTFAIKFKVEYPKAVRLWKDAVRLNDTVASKNAGAIIAGLAGELATFMNLILPHAA